MATTTQDRDLLTSYLADRDVPCPRCGYNLRTLQSNQCPECGEELTLRVGLVYPKLAALITGLVGLSAGAGLNGLLLIYLGIQLALGEMGSNDRFVLRFLAHNGLGFLVEGGLLLAWLVCWHRLHRQTASLRWLLATGTWVLTGINIVVFSFRIN